MRPKTTFNLEYTSKGKSILEDTENQIDSQQSSSAILLESYIKLIVQRLARMNNKADWG